MLNLPAEIFEEMFEKSVLIVIVTSMQNIILYLLIINLSCCSLARSAQAYCSKVIRCLNEGLRVIPHTCSPFYIELELSAKNSKSVRWNYFSSVICSRRTFPENSAYMKNNNGSNTTVLTQSKLYFNKRSQNQTQCSRPSPQDVTNFFKVSLYQHPTNKTPEIDECTVIQAKEYACHQNTWRRVTNNGNCPTFFTNQL